MLFYSERDFYVIKIIKKHLNTISSTNTWAKENMYLFDQSAITLLTADAQTNGRGRLHRTWYSPPSQNIYASFCFYIDQARWKECGSFAQVAALICAELIADHGIEADIKWPNDLLIKGKKIAGILMELVFQPSRCFVILGIGLNVNMPESDLQLIGVPATSLYAELKKKLNLTQVLVSLEKKFLRDYELFLQQGFAPFFADYLKKNQRLIGQQIVFQQGDMQGRGKVESFTTEGYICLRLASGELKIMGSGELIKY